MRPQVGRTTRVKKLQPRAPQQVLRQDQIESDEYDSLQGQYKVETGVEKSEESEIHLQAALAGSGEKEAEEIPAPPAQESSNFDYDALYFKPAKKYCTYIRYSQTVEESNGCQYDMTTEDDTYLTEYNQKKPSTGQLSEDDFERIMEIFENTAEVQSPFASVDQTTIPWETMKLALKQKMEPRYLLVAQEIYEYWKGRRQASGNRPLQPSLKFETHQDNDDGDPYVCFRRREIRQTRKTRARDVQSTDKLKKLRKEIEDGRELVRMALFREVTKKELLAMDKLVFEQRQKVKEAKIRLGIKGDDDDLINQLPRKRKATDFTRPNQQPGSAQIRLPGRADGRPVDADLVSLSELQAKKEADLRDDLAQKALYYRKRNERFVDVTREPLSPVHLPGKELAFRPATAQYQLMTPPSSVTSESSGENINSSKMEIDTAPFRFSSPPPEDEQTQPAYRRRMGRLNRLWIDRRGIPTAPKEMDENVSDRWKYDQDDDDEQPVYTMDEYSTEALVYRSKLASTIFEMRRAQAEAPRHASNSSPAAVRTVAGTSQPAPT